MESRRDDGLFQTTLWSMVGRAGDGAGPEAGESLARLCQLYWKPLYVFALGTGRKAEDAKDLTQGFFLALLTTDAVRLADRQRGKFRTFLLAAFQNHMRDEWDRSRAQKRGGGKVALSIGITDAELAGLVATGDDPAQSYDRQWALGILEHATGILRVECVDRGLEEWFERTVGSGAGEPYAMVAAALGVSEDAIKSFAKRMKRRFREIVQALVADTVDSPADAGEELRYLVSLMGGR